MAGNKIWRLLVPVLLAMATAVFVLCIWLLYGVYTTDILGLTSTVLGLSCLIFGFAFASAFAAWLRWAIFVLAIANAAVAIAAAAITQNDQYYYYKTYLGLMWAMAASAILCALSWPVTTCSITYTGGGHGFKKSSV